MGINLGKLIGGLAKGVGKVAGFAAPFLPGPWGAVAGIGSALLNNDGSEKKANDAANSQNNIAQQQAALFSKYAPAAAEGFAGFANPNANPYTTLAKDNYGDAAIGTRTANIFSPQLGTIADTYGEPAINARAKQLFDPSQLTGDMVGYQDAGDQGYDSAVSAAQADLAGRGFFSPNSLATSAVSQIRQAQGADNAGARRDLVGGLLKSKLNYIAGQTDTRNQLQNTLANNMSSYRGGQYNQGLGLQEKGVDTALSADRDLSGMSSTSAQGAQGTLGGLRGFYADKAQAQQDSLNNAIGGLAASGLQLPSLSGVFGNIFGKRKQSTSLGTTGAQAPSSPAYQPMFAGDMM